MIPRFVQIYGILSYNAISLVAYFETVTVNDAVALTRITVFVAVLALRFSVLVSVLVPSSDFNSSNGSVVIKSVPVGADVFINVLAMTLVVLPSGMLKRMLWKFPKLFSLSIESNLSLLFFISPNLNVILESLILEILLSLKPLSCSDTLAPGFKGSLMAVKLSEESTSVITGISKSTLSIIIASR